MRLSRIFVGKTPSTPIEVEALTTTILHLLNNYEGAMLLDAIKKGTTSYSAMIRIVDATDGTPETGVLWNTAGIDLWYRRAGATVTSITEATQTINGAYATGGFVHVSDGYYRLDLPDGAPLTGVDYFDIGGAVPGMVVIGGRVRLALPTNTQQVNDVTVTGDGSTTPFNV